VPYNLDACRKFQERANAEELGRVGLGANASPTADTQLPAEGPDCLDGCAPAGEALVWVERDEAVSGGSPQPVAATCTAAKSTPSQSQYRPDGEKQIRGGHSRHAFRIVVSTHA